MCGIFCSIHRQGCNKTGLYKLYGQLKAANAARGPDAQDNIEVNLETTAGHPLFVNFYGSELRLRGNKPVIQPHKDESSGDVFCWNGEVFEGLDLDPSENDGARLFDTLRRMKEPDLELPEIFSSIEGPYAMAYFHNATKRVYFGRDPLGRRSLLLSQPTPMEPYIILTSVSDGVNDLGAFVEVDTTSLHCIELTDLDLTKIHDSIRRIPRANGPFSSARKVNTTLPHADEVQMVKSLDVIPKPLKELVDGLISHLSRSVELQVRDIPLHGIKGEARVAVLFSGGIDSTLLAYFADRQLPPDEPIDLLNVAFENPRKIQARKKSSDKPQHRKHNNPSPNATEGLERDHDLTLVPDRVTGLEEVEELRKLSPKRRWNFVEVDIPFEEVTNHRPLVEKIMYPCCTVMDLSLALALYFASRGIGHVRETSDSTPVPYTSTARVLLNGLGSDELLGGYGRHRTAYVARGWQAVIDELQLEIDRIPLRNLGRDDRIISCHGKEARHPFLSLSVVNFLAGLRVDQKLDPRLPVGIGEKTLLRLAAHSVGLELAARRKKRAMQFGSHSARMEGGLAERKGHLLLQNDNI